MNIGLELKVARVIAGKQQSEVAAAVGITVPYLSGIENGKYVPSSNLLHALQVATRWTQDIADLVQTAAPIEEEVA